MKLGYQQFYRNVKQRLSGRGREADSARPASAFDDSSASFNALLPALAEKWREAPGGSDQSDRRFTDDLLNQSDDDLLEYWKRQYDASREQRGWWWRLYCEILRDRKVLEIGSGMGYDAMFFAGHGAVWTCCDIALSNLQLIERVAEAKQLDIGVFHIDSVKAFDALPSDFDFVWCNGSLHHIPFEQAREECAAILPHMKLGGRWIELAYPRERWVREGERAFSEWGKMTDGERTPWAEWYDIERLKVRLHPGRFETVFEHRFNSDQFIWMDARYAETGSREALPRPVAVTPPANMITTPPFLWRHAWSMPLDDIDQGEAITAEIVCSVQSGTIALAFERGGHRVSREILAEARTGTQLLYLSTSVFGPGIRLTVRNGSALGSSRLRIKSISLRPSLDPADAPEERRCGSRWS
jgi:hypothetical protein